MNQYLLLIWNDKFPAEGKLPAREAMTLDLIPKDAFDKRQSNGCHLSFYCIKGDTEKGVVVSKYRADRKSSDTIVLTYDSQEINTEDIYPGILTLKFDCFDIFGEPKKDWLPEGKDKTKRKSGPGPKKIQWINLLENPDELVQDGAATKDGEKVMLKLFELKRGEYGY